jgi:glycosyltransferase involved in cell wall biosynthesis
VTPNLAQPGGAERTLLILARYADPDRMECVGVVVAGSGSIDEALGRELRRYAEIHTDERRQRWWPGSPCITATHPSLNAAIRHACREADVLVAWGTLHMAPHVAGLTIPVVVVSHSDRPVQARITGVDRLVSVSEAGRRYFSGPGADGWPPAAVIPNGVEVDRACPARGRAWQRARWGVGPGDKVLLYLGRQARIKNPWAAVEALAALGPGYRLVMAGNQSINPAEPMPSVVELVHQLGLEARVLFLPPQAHVGDLLAGADCLLLLSFAEADNMAVKEAFLAGLPVVHTPVGSFPEMEAELGPVGWEVALRPDAMPHHNSPWRAAGESPPVDPDEVAAQVRRALSPDAAPLLGKMRAIALDRWTGAAMCSRWADYLEEVVAAWTP